MGAGSFSIEATVGSIRKHTKNHRNNHFGWKLDKGEYHKENFMSVLKDWGTPLAVSRQEARVVILNYALTAEQPDPCGPEPYSPGKRPRTRSPLGEGPVMPRVPEEVALSQNSWRPRTSCGVPDPHILSGPLSRERPTPRLGLVRSHHVSVDTGTRAGPHGFH